MPYPYWLQARDIEHLMGISKDLQNESARGHGTAHQGEERNTACTQGLPVWTTKEEGQVGVGTQEVIQSLRGWSRIHFVKVQQTQWNLQGQEDAASANRKTEPDHGLPEEPFPAQGKTSSQRVHLVQCA